MKMDNYMKFVIMLMEKNGEYKKYYDNRQLNQICNYINGKEKENVKNIITMAN